MKTKLTSSTKVHWATDGVVAVDAERHQDVRRRVRHKHLRETNDFTRNISRVPGDCDLPDDVREDTDYSHTQIYWRSKKNLIQLRMIKLGSNCAIFSYRQ
jgi:hypothetical protein